MVKRYANAKSDITRDRRRANHPELPSQDIDLLQRFADSQLVERGLSRNTINAYASDLRFFAAALQQTDARLLTARRADVMAFLSIRASDGSSSRSAARLLSALRRFYAWCLREKLISENPTDQVS